MDQVVLLHALVIRALIIRAVSPPILASSMLASIPVISTARAKAALRRLALRTASIREVRSDIGIKRPAFAGRHDVNEIGHQPLSIIPRTQKQSVKRWSAIK